MVLDDRNFYDKYSIAHGNSRDDPEVEQTILPYDVAQMQIMIYQGQSTVEALDIMRSGYIEAMTQEIPSHTKGRGFKYEVQQDKKMSGQME